MRPLQPLYRDDKGIVRFRANAIVRRLLDFATERGLSLNELAAEPYSPQDREQFAQLIGYSLCGFGDLSYVSGETYAAAERSLEPAPKTYTLEEIKAAYWKGNLGEITAFMRRHDWIEFLEALDPELGDKARRESI